MSTFREEEAVEAFRSAERTLNRMARGDCGSPGCGVFHIYSDDALSEARAVWWEAFSALTRLAAETEEGASI